MPAGSRELEDSQAVYPPPPYDTPGTKEGGDRHLVLVPQQTWLGYGGGLHLNRIGSLYWQLG